MKLVQLSKLYWPDNGGGIARVVETVSYCFKNWSKNRYEQGLIKTPYRQEIIVCRPDSKLPMVHDMYKGIRITRCTMLADIASTPISPSFLLETKKRTQNADIVICNFPYPMIDLAIYLRLVKGKKLYWWHCDFAKNKHKLLSKIYEPFIRHSLNVADKIVVCAEGNINGSDFLKPYRNKCIVIPHAVDKKWEVEGKKHYLSYKDEKPKEKRNILFIGRFVWYKGIDLLLKAYKRIQNDSYSLTLVGDGPLLEDMKLLAKTLDLHNISFAGSVTEEEKAEYIKKSDFLVLPSISKAESFAIVQIEAMAYGKPVINTKLNSGVPEVSIDGISGLTVDPNRVDQMALAMQRLCEDDILRAKLSMGAVELVETKYTMEIMEKKYYKLFDELLL
ncbi:glycosyltransferase [bacterium D16-54]|nr:glycosyltransferase [bacterium D16-54]RKJ13447.1 glycosyltransferase [bacterium D16-56]